MVFGASAMEWLDYIRSIKFVKRIRITVVEVTCVNNKVIIKLYFLSIIPKKRSEDFNLVLIEEMEQFNFSCLQVFRS